MNDPTAYGAPDSASAQQFRSQVGRISRQSGVFFAGTIFTAAFGYAFKVYLARVLGAEALGVYALGITLVGFVGIFNSLGLPESAVRFAAVYRATHQPEQLRTLLWRGGAILSAANVLFGVIFLRLGSVVARRFYHSPSLARYLPWFASLMLLGVISSFYGKILVGYKAVDRRTLITNFIASPATMLLTVLLLRQGYGLRGYLLAQVATAALVIVLLLIVVRRHTPREARFLRPWPAPLEPEVWSFSGTAVTSLLLEFVMVHSDKVALGYCVGAREVGIYSVAAAVVAYESLVLGSVNQVFSPVIADLHSQGDRAMLARLYKGLTKWVLGLTLPLAITVMVCARPLMHIFGHDFEAGWPVLIIGTAGQLVNCGVGSAGLLLWMSGNQGRLLRVQTAMAGVMIVANVALVPAWGIIGAAVAAALTNAGTNAWNLLEVRKALGLSPFSPGFLRLLVPAAASVLVTLALSREAHKLGPEWLMIGVSLLAAYGVFAGLTAILGLDSDDRMIAGAIWSRIRRSISS
ncbi:MAG TPA: oligosaccharide flippase family protein [Candidatus Sulfotelmatobacter sp.]|nr:oligosaccharide flippase family protein [Candidatus Sulfotelmatobacter sp.]